MRLKRGSGRRGLESYPPSGRHPHGGACLAPLLAGIRVAPPRAFRRDLTLARLAAADTREFPELADAAIRGARPWNRNDRSGFSAISIDLGRAPCALLGLPPRFSRRASARFPRRRSMRRAPARPSRPAAPWQQGRARAARMILGRPCCPIRTFRECSAKRSAAAPARTWAESSRSWWIRPD